MKLLPSERSILARELGLVEGDVHRRGVAGLLRMALARWGLSPRRALTRYARQQLEAVQVASPSTTTLVGNVLDYLQTLRECDDVLIGSERYVAPAYSRWIRTGPHAATLLGVDPVPSGLKLLEPLTQGDMVRRVRIGSDEDVENLYASQFEECSLDEWLRPLHYLRHHRRRVGHPVREDQITLHHFWEVLVATVSAEGRPAASDGDLRVLAGTPGTHFGKYSSAQCEGRWTTEPDDGVWCAYRRGYGDSHWHPVIVLVDGSDRRIVDLYDHDEWRWAILARAKATEVHEVVRENGEVVEFTHPLPSQVRTAMDLMGPWLRGWAWQVPEGATRLWRDLL